ncbi:MAG: DUF58 domain-containing protein [Candidatus Eisenbacteria bacterium]|nr:DUF58 domain-containing protein [Candidatus Eisenbacteria bacterium]
MLPKELIGEIRRIEITTRSLVESLFSGEYHSVFKGRGMEFDQVREYQDGDDVRAIDWNVTARMNRPFVKEFVEERELVVMLLVDRSASTDFGTAPRSKANIAARISALLAFSAIQNHDKVGLILFSDVVEKFIAPRKGRRHVLRVILELLYGQPEKKKTSLAAPLERLNRVQKRRSVVFLVSDFLERPPEELLRVTNRRHDVIAVRVADPREIGPGRREKEKRGLPRLARPAEEPIEPTGTGPDGERKGFTILGSADVEDLETGEIAHFRADRAFVEAYNARRRRSDDELEEFFRANGVDFVSVETQGDYVEPLVRFFRARERRLLR